MNPQRRGQWAGLGAAVLFGCSAPLISTVTGSGSALSIAGLLYGGATWPYWRCACCAGPGPKLR